MEQFPEWDYRRKEYARVSTIETHSPKRRKYAEVQRFENNFGIIPTVLEHSFQGYKAPQKFFEKRTKKIGRLNPNYVIDEIVRAHNNQELTQRVYDTHLNSTIVQRECNSLFGILLDMSGSTGNNVDLKYTRSDLIKFASLALGRVLDSLEEPFFIYGYHTNSRGNPTIIEEYKRLSDAWNNDIEERIASVEPGGETREVENKDGVAIRYVNKILKKFENRNKYIIIVTDGEPYCGDTYYIDEIANYDTAKAMQEGTNEKIKYLYLTINPDDASEFLNIINPYTEYSKQFKSMRDVVEGLPLAYEKIKLLKNY